MVKLKKLSEARSLIKDNMCSGFCEDNVDAYLQYIEQHFNKLVDLVWGRTEKLDNFTVLALIQDVSLLQDLIKIIMREEED